MISVNGNNQVIPLSTFGEIFLRVIDNVIRANRARDIEVLRTAHSGHFSPERFSNLHRKRAHTAACAVDEDALPRLNVPFVAYSQKSRQSRCGNGGRRLERQVARFQREILCPWANIFPTCTPTL